MGDRRNVVVEFDNGTSVALYTHWTGSALPNILADALDRGRGRWDDPTYLTRIIFSEMIQDTVLEETGFGIEPIPTGSTSYCEASPGYDLHVKISDKQVIHDGISYHYGDFIKRFGG